MVIQEENSLDTTKPLETGDTTGTPYLRRLLEMEWDVPIPIGRLLHFLWKQVIYLLVTCSNQKWAWLSFFHAKMTHAFEEVKGITGDCSLVRNGKLPRSRLVIEKEKSILSGQFHSTWKTNTIKDGKKRLGKTYTVSMELSLRLHLKQKKKLDPDPSSLTHGNKEKSCISAEDAGFSLTWWSRQLVNERFFFS